MTIPEPNGAPEEAPDRSTRNLVVKLLVALSGCGIAFGLYLRAMEVMDKHDVGYWPHVGATVIFCAAILAVIAFASRVGGRTSSDCSAAARTYRRRALLAAGTYMLTLTAAIGLRDQLHPGGVLAYAVAIAPAIPLIGMLIAIGVYLREEPDEFLRAVQAEGCLWATGGTLAIATVWGFLEMFKLVPHVEAWAAFPIWCLLLGPGQIIARRRYR